jgi:hypothetical protein
MRCAFLLLIAAVTCGSQAANSGGGSEGDIIDRGPAMLFPPVLPAFPATGVADSSLVVDIRFAVNEGGDPFDIQVTTPPSPADAAVIEAVLRWSAVPPVCRGWHWISAHVRTSVVFSIENGRNIVTIRAPRWFAAGEDVQLPRLPPGEMPARLRVLGPDPVFPPRAIANDHAIGLIHAAIWVDADGFVTSVPRIFSWPGLVFEAAARDAMMKWRIVGDSGLPLGEPFLHCVRIAFTLRDAS